MSFSRKVGKGQKRYAGVKIGSGETATQPGPQIWSELLGFCYGLHLEQKANPGCKPGSGDRDVDLPSAKDFVMGTVRPFLTSLGVELSNPSSMAMRVGQAYRSLGEGPFQKPAVRPSGKAWQVYLAVDDAGRTRFPKSRWQEMAIVACDKLGWKLGFQLVDKAPPAAGAKAVKA